MPDFTPLHRKLELAIAAYLARVITDVPAVTSESDDKAPLPRIVVRCRELKEKAPRSGIFEGDIEVVVICSADDGSVDDHFAIAARAQSELADEAAVLSALNSPATHRPVLDFHLYHIWASSMATDPEGRSFRTTLGFRGVAMGIDRS